MENKIIKEPMLEKDIKCHYQIIMIDNKKYAQIGCCDGDDANCPRYFNFKNCGDCEYRIKYIPILEVQNG